jgi:hypothetical protein
MYLVVRRGLDFQNLERLRKAIYGLPGPDSVLLNRTGDSFFLIGFKEISGRSKPISVEIPRLWLEDAAMLESVDRAAMQFASLMAENTNQTRSRVSNLTAPPSDTRPFFLKTPR